MKWRKKKWGKKKRNQRRKGDVKCVWTFFFFFLQKMTLQSKKSEYRRLDTKTTQDDGVKPMHSQLCGENRIPVQQGHRPQLVNFITNNQVETIQDHDWTLTMTQTRDTKQPIVLGGKAVTRKGRTLHTGSPVALITVVRTKRYFFV